MVPTEIHRCGPQERHLGFFAFAVIAATDEGNTRERRFGLTTTDLVRLGWWSRNCLSQRSVAQVLAVILWPLLAHQLAMADYFWTVGDVGKLWHDHFRLGITNLALVGLGYPFEFGNNAVYKIGWRRSV